MQERGISLQKRLVHRKICEKMRQWARSVQVPKHFWWFVDFSWGKFLCPHPTRFYLVLLIFLEESSSAPILPVSIWFWWSWTYGSVVLNVGQQ
jgi:hypothetical protein